MNFWKDIEENLWDEGFDVMNENGSILWKSEKGTHSIKYKDVAVDRDKLAWYQDEEYGKSWVKVKYSNGFFLSWKPISNHSDYGFNFRYIKWFGNKLIVIYTEKHKDYIIKIENLTVTVLYSGNIDKIQIEEERIYIKSYNEITQIISLKFDNTTVYNMTVNEFNDSFRNVQLEAFLQYFLFCDKDYNKNYS